MENVLFILNYSNSFEGSFIRSITALAEELANNEQKSVFLLPYRSKETEWAVRLAESGADVYFFSPSFFSITKNIFLIKKIIKNHNIAIIHSHFAGKNIHLAVSGAIWNRKNVDYIVHVHTEPKKRNALYDRLAAFFTNATLYIAVSESIENSLSITGRKAVTIPNAVDFSRLDFVDRTVKREDYISSPEQKIAFMFGSSYNAKGVDFVIRSLSEYDKAHRIQLLIAAPENRDEIRKLIKDTYGHFPSWIKLLPPRNDIATYFSLADVFVSANRCQGCPYTMIECAYLGVPIIYRDVPGINELNIPWSVKINSDDTASLYKAICEIVGEDENETLVMGAESKEYVVSRFSLGSWVYEIINTYKNIGRV